MSRAVRAWATQERSIRAHRFVQAGNCDCLAAGLVDDTDRVAERTALLGDFTYPTPG